MTTIYQSSTGPKIIAEMNPHNLAAAHAKLIRERKDDSRDAEIEAMGAVLAQLAEVAAEVEAEAEQASVS